MANFNRQHFIKHDDYYTPRHVWEDLRDTIPLGFFDGKTIYEPFYGDGTSGRDIQEVFPKSKVLHEAKDFYEWKPECDLILSNPPFSDLKKIFHLLTDQGKPFMLIAPVSKMNTQYTRKYLKDQVQIIIPKKRINFKKRELNGEMIKSNRCNFDTIFMCYKMNLPKDIMWM